MNLEFNSPLHASQPTNQTPIQIVSFVGHSAEQRSTRANFGAEFGWKVLDHFTNGWGEDDHAILLVLDEIWAPVLQDLSADQWASFQSLLSSGKKVLWVTRGAMLRGDQPENALIYGMVRTARAEDPSLRFKVLDLESRQCPYNAITIGKVLQIYDYLDENEYVERSGILHIGRIIKDDTSTESGGPSLLFERHSLRSSLNPIRLECGQLGDLDSLIYTECTDPGVVPDGFVEVEIYAAGLNFKVIATPAWNG